MGGYWKDPSTLTPTSTSAWTDPLVVDGRVLGDTEQLEIQVSVSRVNGGSTLHRLSSGDGIKQTVWKRRVVRLSGTGHVPPKISDVDWDGPVTISGQMLGTPVTGFSERGPEESHDAQRAEWRWTLTLEEG